MLSEAGLVISGVCPSVSLCLCVCLSVQKLKICQSCNLCCRQLYSRWHTLHKPAPEIGAIGLNSMPDSGASFLCRCMTYNTIGCLRALKAGDDVRIRSDASALKTGAGIWCPIYSIDFWSVCQGPKWVHFGDILRWPLTLWTIFFCISTWHPCLRDIDLLCNKRFDGESVSLTQGVSIWSSTHTAHAVNAKIACRSVLFHYTV